MALRAWYLRSVAVLVLGVSLGGSAAVVTAEVIPCGTQAAALMGLVGSLGGWLTAHHLLPEEGDR